MKFLDCLCKMMTNDMYMLHYCHMMVILRLCDGHFPPEGEVALDHVLGQCPQDLKLFRSAKVDASERVGVFCLH